MGSGGAPPLSAISLPAMINSSRCFWDSRDWVLADSPSSASFLGSVGTGSVRLLPEREAHAVKLRAHNAITSALNIGANVRPHWRGAGDCPEYKQNGLAASSAGR